MAREAEPVREVPNVENDFDVKAMEYIHLKRESAELSSREKAIKADLMSAIEESGEQDAEGHLVLALSSEFDGVTGLVRQRRVSTGKLDEGAAERILKEAGLWERCAPPVPTVQEDEVYAALYEGLLTEDQIFEMYPEKVTYALVMRK